jgi:hypothetical protein
MIYFIQDGNNYIKIGYTSDSADTRRKAGQTWNPSDLKVLLTIEGEQSDEAALHRQFASAGVVREWFKPVPELISYLLEQRARVAANKAWDAGFQASPVVVDEDVPHWPLNIYLAGKIEKNCWRHSIVTGLCNALPKLVSCPVGEVAWSAPEWPVLPRAIFGEHDYFHGNDSHGIAAQMDRIDVHDEQRAVNDSRGHATAPEGRMAPEVVRLCLEAIGKADVLFAWVDQLDCYGTVSEIGYAKALGKRVWIRGPRVFRDMWFLYEMAGNANAVREANDPAQALSALLEATGKGIDVSTGLYF